MCSNNHVYPNQLVPLPLCSYNTTKYSETDMLNPWYFIGRKLSYLLCIYKVSNVTNKFVQNSNLLSADEAALNSFADPYIMPTSARDYTSLISTSQLYEVYY
jgi:hypothetical protein